MTDDFLERFEAQRAARLAAERSFQLAGETLVHRASVSPKTGLKLEDARRRVAFEAIEIQKLVGDMNGSIPDELVRLVSGQTTDGDLLQVADEVIIACLEDESLPAWARLRDDDATYPLSLTDVMQIADYLIERVTGIPTDAPADSSAGREQTARQSKAASSSKAKTSSA